MKFKAMQSGSTPLRKKPSMANQNVSSFDSKRVLLGAAADAAMSRKLVWIEQKRFQGFGCSECGWRFKPSAAPTGKSFDEMMRNFELRRDKEFTSHVCAEPERPRDRNSG